MNVHISYKVPKNPGLEKDFQHNIDKLQRRLQVFRPELVHLRGAIEQNSAREGFLVSLNLRLPSGQMAAQEKGPAAAVAIKGAFDDLTEQLTKHKDRLRNQHKWVRRRQAGPARPQPQVPFEQTVAAVLPEKVSEQDISSYVNANLDRLYRFVSRELRFRENAGEFAPDQVAREEIVDEAIARALGDSEERPERLALEPWLYRLALRAMDELAGEERAQPEKVPLEQSARQPNVRGSYEPQLQYHQPDELLTRESVIADQSALTPEQMAASDEIIAMVDLALRGAEREQREAFVLYALEGFSVEEIAAISDRKPEDVRAAVGAARDLLRNAMPVSGVLKQKLLEHSKIA
jgi:RNA polymerase sigma factor (sigma-70 family)